MPEQTWSIRVGAWLFRHRSLTPLPLIVLSLLLFRPPDLGGWNLPLLFAGLGIALAGEAVRVVAVGHAASGTSGRESYLRADDLNTTGLYSLVRNPLYLGNLLIYAGLLAAWGHPLALLLVLAALSLQYALVVRAEESYLIARHGPVYEGYCWRVPRWLPKRRGGCPPARPFDLKRVVLKENDSLFNLLAMFLLIVAWKGYLRSGRVPAPWLLGGMLFLLLAAYAGVKAFKRWRSRD